VKRVEREALVACIWGADKVVPWEFQEQVAAHWSDFWDRKNLEAAVFNVPLSRTRWLR
jgi:hypothetical protein